MAHLASAVPIEVAKSVLALLEGQQAALAGQIDPDLAAALTDEEFGKRVKACMDCGRTDHGIIGWDRF